MIELDVLWLPDGHPKAPAAERSPLVVAHDWHDARRREPLTLTEALDAFTRPPLDRVEIDCDVKLPGREEELAAALARARPDRADDGLDHGAEHPGAAARARPGAEAGLDLSQGDPRLDLEALGDPRRLRRAAR